MSHTAADPHPLDKRRQEPPAEVLAHWQWVALTMQDAAVVAAPATDSTMHAIVANFMSVSELSLERVLVLVLRCLLLPVVGLVLRFSAGAHRETENFVGGKQLLLG
jgi:hypothetical protein